MIIFEAILLTIVMLAEIFGVVWIVEEKRKIRKGWKDLADAYEELAKAVGTVADAAKLVKETAEPKLARMEEAMALAISGGPHGRTLN